jgi:hypothetical protein
MRPIVIIVIAVVCSVVAVFGVMIGTGFMITSIAEQKLDSYYDNNCDVMAQEIFSLEKTIEVDGVSSSGYWSLSSNLKDLKTTYGKYCN